MSELILRPLTIADANLTWKWRNQEGVQTYYSNHSFEVTLQDELNWYAKNIEAVTNTRIFGVEVNGELVGITSLKNIQPIHKLAEFAILIDEAYSGKGYGTNACAHTLAIAFGELNLHRVFLKVRTDNIPAIRIYEQCGFKKEGTLKEDFFKAGTYHDQFIMAILKAEYKRR